MPRISNFGFRVSIFGLPLLSGLLLVACFPKLHLPALVWFACLPLLAALATERSLRRAFLLGYVFGAVLLAGSCYWFVGVLEIYGRLAPAEAWGSLVAFLMVFSAFFGGFGLLVGWGARRSPGWALALSPFLWVGMELARTYLITGFPWNLLGYAVQSAGLRQIASFTGVYGLSFLPVATSALLAWVFLEWCRRRSPRLADPRNIEMTPHHLTPFPPRLSLGERREQEESGVRSSGPTLRGRVAWMALLVWAVLLFLVQWVLEPAPASVGSHLAYLVQPDVPLDEFAEQWAPWRNPQHVTDLIALTERAACEGKVPVLESRASNCATGRPASDPHPLLIWAENSAPLFFQRDPVFTAAMVRMARETEAYTVFNTVMFAGPGTSRPRNSSIVLDPAGRVVLQYDKIHLVPFGEYVPAWAFPGVIGKIVAEVGDFVPGATYKTATTPAGNIGVFICYEAIFPQLVRRLAASAGVLVNISNDAWYGDSAAAYQHLEMARLRAIENHRYLLRATNDGVTAVIDPYGRLLARLPRHQQLVLRAQFNFEARETFYTAQGDVFAWSCAAIAAIMMSCCGVSYIHKSKHETS